MEIFDFLIAAGDPSGDLHGSRLIAALKELNPSAKIAAIGGPFMKEEADQFLDDLAGEGIVGFLEPLLKMPRLLNTAFRIRDFLNQGRAKALVCIDYYGFNRRLLEFAFKARVPAYYYVSPQVWASRPYRVRVIGRLVQKIFVIFPFEEKLYRDSGVACEFVGHPLLDIIPEPKAKTEIPRDPLIGILPGSRKSEVSRHLPIFLESFKIFKKRFPGARAMVFAARALSDSSYQVQDSGIEIVREFDYQKRARLDGAFCSSGTATLENALLGIPMVVAYKMSWPTYFLARSLIKVPYIAMANILAGKKIVPELIQDQVRPEALAESLSNFWESPQNYFAAREELIALRKRLGNPGVSERVARALMEEAKDA